MTFDLATSVLVVIPTYNERDNIASLIDEILALGAQYRVLVVDDSSPDGTGDLVAELQRAHAGRVELLPVQPSRGSGERTSPAFSARSPPMLA